MSVFIVAEAGVNHLGDRAKMLALCDAAKAAGADAVKFQAYYPDRLIERRGITDPATIKLLNDAYVDNPSLDAIAAHCKAIGIKWFASVFDLSQVERVLSRGACALKIGHAEAGWMELIKECDKHRGAVLCIISNPAWAGMYRPDGAESNPRRMWKDVHCVEKYPADGHNPELWRVGSREHHFAGFSSHYTDYRIPAAAALRGAEYIEAHLMLGDGELVGETFEFSEPEAAWSLSPAEFAEMVKLIREYESWL